MAEYRVRWIIAEKAESVLQKYFRHRPSHPFRAFYLSAIVSLFSSSPAAQNFFPFSTCMLFTHIMAFSPLMCLYFSLCFVRHIIHCFFIAKCLLHFDSGFCSGKFRLLLTLLLLWVSLTMEICTIFTESVAAPCIPQVPGSGGAVGAERNQPIGVSKFALLQWEPAGLGSSIRALAPVGQQQATNPQESPAAPSCLQKFKRDSTRNRNPPAPRCLQHADLPGLLSFLLLLRAGTNAVPPTQWQPGQCLGSHCLQTMPSHLCGGYLPVRTCLSSFRTETGIPWARKAFEQRRKVLIWRRLQVVEREWILFSNIALPFCGLAKTALRDIIKVFKKHLSLLKQSWFAILLFCCRFIILCKWAVYSLLQHGLQRDRSPMRKFITRLSLLRLSIANEGA